MLRLVHIIQNLKKNGACQGLRPLYDGSEEAYRLYVRWSSMNIQQVLRRIAAVQYASDFTDGELLDAFTLRRDGACFEALVRRHGPMVLGVCQRVLRDP